MKGLFSACTPQRVNPLYGWMSSSRLVQTTAQCVRLQGCGPGVITCSTRALFFFFFFPFPQQSGFHLENKCWDHCLAEEKVNVGLSPLKVSMLENASCALNDGLPNIIWEVVVKTSGRKIVTFYLCQMFSVMGKKKINLQELLGNVEFFCWKVC